MTKTKRWISLLCACALLASLVRPAYAENASGVVSGYRQSIASYDEIYNRMADAVSTIGTPIRRAFRVFSFSMTLI